MIDPTPPLSELGDFRMGPLQLGDSAYFRELAGQRENGLLFDMPETDEEYLQFFESLRSSPLSLPMLFTSGSHATGVAFMTSALSVSLSAYLVAMFRRPERSRDALVLYVRNVFWSAPLHRLYTHIPLVPETLGHCAALLSAGFVREGVYREHLAAGEVNLDVAVFGLLREDFDRWAGGHPEAAL
jgi:hypothetical protein